MTPEALAAAGWPRIVEGTIVATQLPTCSGSSFDFFVASRNIRHAVMGIERIKDARLQPHFPVRLLLKGDAGRLAVRKLTKAPKVGGVLPHGPGNKPACFAEVSRLAKCGDVTKATRFVEHHGEERMGLSHWDGPGLQRLQDFVGVSWRTNYS